MRRYSGQPVAPDARIAVVSNDALGNYAVASVVCQALKRRSPEGEVVLLSGGRVKELTAVSRWADRVIDFLGPDPVDTARKLADEPRFDFVFNMENTAWAKTATALLCGEETLVAGPCVAPDGRGDLAFGETPFDALWQDKEWISEQITERHPMLRSGFIGEIFVRLAGVEGEVPGYDIPSVTPPISVPDVLIATTASLPEKLWPVEKWTELIRSLRAEGLSVGVVGAKPKEQGTFWKGADAEGQLVGDDLAIDLRGTMTLPEVVGALGSAKFVVTLDNGILHFAASTGVPVFGLFRNGIHRLWAPAVENVVVIEPGTVRSVGEISVADVLGRIKNADLN